MHQIQEERKGLSPKKPMAVTLNILCTAVIFPILMVLGVTQRLCLIIGRTVKFRNKKFETGKGKAWK